MDWSIKDNPIWQGFNTLRYLATSMMQHGIPRGLLVTGPPGFGKTTTIEDIYRKMYHVDIPVLNPSPAKFVQVLSEHASDRVIVLDDVHRVIKTGEFVDMLKRITDSKSNRRMSHDRIGKTNIEPFDVTACLALIFNADIANPNRWSPTYWEEHIEPLVDRMTSVRLSFKRADMLEYTSWLAPKILDPMRLGSSGLKLTHNQKEEIIEHLLTYHKDYARLSPRTIYKLGQMRLVAPDNAVWARIRATELLRDASEDARSVMKLYEESSSKAEVKAEETLAEQLLRQRR